MHDALHDETRLYIDGAEHPSLHTTADTHGGQCDKKYALFDFVASGRFLELRSGKTAVPKCSTCGSTRAVCAALDDTRIGCDASSRVFQPRRHNAEHGPVRHAPSAAARPSAELGSRYCASIVVGIGLPAAISMTALQGPFAYSAHVKSGASVPQ